ncbi:ABC transporter ATP-binding protein [Arachnia propionica]|uniref:ABC transporter ATP-binding protein n=1 Tax=Arachnia propionica TaxID=1750 RepID=A0A3P1TC94_9ACTN|nr:ATP-binding cassette domain-containing protein [Arachnia propionica]RRD07029.1 ABC transporter ATP-binding protein [Arachnia propionica]
MTEHLVLSDVSLSRGGNTLIADLSLTVRPGQVLAVTGASGVGKTTLLRAISGLSPCDGGSVIRPEGRVAQVFQEPRLLPWYSAHRNVALVVRHEFPDLIAQQWLARVDLAHATHLHPAQLSGGMRQRVAIARAMATEPALLLVDEPFSALDRPLATALRGDLVALLAQEAVITIWVTHDLEEAEAVSHLHLELDGPPGTWRLTDHDKEQ